MVEELCGTHRKEEGSENTIFFSTVSDKERKMLLVSSDVEKGEEGGRRTNRDLLLFKVIVDGFRVGECAFNETSVTRRALIADDDAKRDGNPPGICNQVVRHTLRVQEHQEEQEGKE